MKATTLSFLMLFPLLSSLAQTPGGPVLPSTPPPAAPAAEPQMAKPAPSAPVTTTPEAPAAPDDGTRVIVPAETTIPIILQTPINTKSAYVGASFYCESVYPITVGNRVIIPRGSSVKGAITQVVRPGRVKGKGQIGVRFDELVLPNGTTVQLRAVLSGFGSTRGGKFKPGEGRIEGEGSKGQDAGKIVEGTLSGGELGTIIGLGRGAPGTGAAIGAGAGAVGSIIWVLASRGKDVVLPYGTSLELKLTQAIDFSRWEVEPRTPYDEGPSLPRREYGPRN